MALIVAGGLFVFYGIFYCVLGAFFAICMKGMLHTIDEKVPYWTQDRSLIGSSPGNDTCTSL